MQRTGRKAPTLHFPEPERSERRREEAKLTLKATPRFFETSLSLMLRISYARCFAAFVNCLGFVII